ncbi:MAG TPA: peptide chain release factor N(5)-glutamine methyltransferase [Spirochaeta sp.]|nr:peptide chain release factor N(5)-glutamine methyltransferase [Spirochaeta sp.]
MTFREALSGAAEKLRKAEILFCDTPMLDASVLLAEAADMSREKLFASYPDTVSPEVLAEYEKLLEKRLSGLPVSYIRNRKEFFGREFYVDSSVLVPRPDTEVIIEKALQLLERSSAVLDLCTGSGCIAATLKLEQPDLSLTASDISKPALTVASRNADALDAKISFAESNLFENISGRFDMIVTNPPYLKTGETDGMTTSGWPEPMLALDGGGDGLDLIRIIIITSLDYLNDNGYLLIEAGPQQAEVISALLQDAGFSDIEITHDMAGRNRVTSGRVCGTHNNEI